MTDENPAAPSAPQLLKTVADVRRWRAQARSDGKTVGFVPTMGALHDGHLSLFRASKSENDLTLASIFVNPTQFNDATDLEKYPRTLDADFAACAHVGVDAIFAPDAAEMYADDDRTRVDVYELTDGLCGLSRPGHFRGVTTVVLKLFNIAQPHRAYFGRKDAQQLFVVRRMVRDLMLDVEIIDCPIIRDADGLALSSRNARLTPPMRKDALAAMRQFAVAVERFNAGRERRPLDIIARMMENIISTTREVEIDYAQFVHLPDLTEADEPVPGQDYMFAIALIVGGESPVRLIDNYFVKG